MSIVAILGSARNDGNAAHILDAVLEQRAALQFDLGELHIRDYAYGQAADGDDFLALAQAIARCDAVLFATPVYWYTMSAVLKRFFDRLTDLVTVQKSVGRKLTGRSVWVVACGSDPALPDGFEVPFRETAAYFGMCYGGALYVQMQEGKRLWREQRGRAASFGSAIYNGANGASAGLCSKSLDPDAGEAGTG
jgi:hypothetical protein